MLKKTELLWDKYMQYLAIAINTSKAMQRAEYKPMSTPRAARESHIVSRASHQKVAAIFAKKIAHGLGLNENYAYMGMLMHDIGHPFSGHEGSVIFNEIKRMRNCGYFHHNANGVDVAISENICGRAINEIPEKERTPEVIKQLEEEFYYFLDIIISHDGEATKLEREKKAVEYSSIKEAVLTKLRLSDSQNEYKFIAQTPEGKIGKYADVIAYIASDILDGFRLDQIAEFDDEYLYLFGEAFTDNPNSSREEKIAYAKKVLKQIKKDKLRELKSDVYNEENKEVLGYLQEIMELAESKGIDLSKIKPEEETIIDKILEEKIRELERTRKKEIRVKQKESRKEVRKTSRSVRKSRKSFSISREEQEKMKKLRKAVKRNKTEQLQCLYSDIEKLREFVGKIRTVNTSVVDEMTSRLQDFLANDIIETSLVARRHQNFRKSRKSI